MPDYYINIHFGYVFVVFVAAFVFGICIGFNMKE